MNGPSAPIPPTSHGTSRRAFLGAVAMAPLAAVTLSACGSSGPGEGGAGAAATYWYLSGEPDQTITQDSVDVWNGDDPDSAIDITYFQNDAYKTKIRTAIGAGEAPTIVYGWGGGTLRAYAEAGQVDDLTPWFDEHPEIRERLFASSFPAATVDDKIYALPSETVAPIVFYVNSDLFEQVGVQPPKTWGDVMSLVTAFNDAGIAPFALGGQSRWTSMMWLEYLFDRIGGEQLFTSIYDGEPDAWSAPAAIEALTKVQDLVRAGGFITGFESITADSNADQALLYTGRAAMMLHGAWTYGSMKSDGGDFVSSGGLGWIPFPTVEGGAGDPSNTVGNPGQYNSIYSGADQEAKDAALAFFEDGIFTDEVVADYIATGNVPIVNGTEAQLAESEDAEFLTFIYDMASNANYFGQSWDQALSPAVAEKLLTNIDQLFSLSIDPQQFATAMNATLAG